jgi:Tol biopolymer transport system component
MARRVASRPRRAKAPAPARPPAPPVAKAPPRRAARPPARRRGLEAVRPLHLACALALLLALGALAWDLSEEWRTAPAAVAGQLVVPVRGGLAAIESATGRAQVLVRGSDAETITSAAWSRDRARIAYGVFHRVQGDQVSSGEIMVMPAGGGPARTAVPRDRPGSVADTPRWSPDGQHLYFAYQGLDGRTPVARLERVRLADGDRARLFEDATFPDVSPDGRSLVFVRDDIQGQGLAIGPAEGGEAREIVARGQFRSIMGPRFSPDGARIAFTAVGPGPNGAAPPESPSGLLATLLDVFSVRTAYAHGDPWDVWTVRPDGSDLRRASPLQEDEPLVAWSPDGAWIAVHGMNGLWVVSASGTVEPRRIAEGSFGAIDW